MFHRFRLAPVLVVTAAIVAGAWPAAAFAATQPRLGTALNFAAIAGSTITNTGPTVIKGNVALSPGSAVTGFPPGISAVRNIADANAVQAKTDLVTAFTDAGLGAVDVQPDRYERGRPEPDRGRVLVGTVGAVDGKAHPLGYRRLHLPHRQRADHRDRNRRSRLPMAHKRAVCTGKWAVPPCSDRRRTSRATLMALTSITMVTGANIISGRAMARNGALTLDDNEITPPSGTCTAASTTRTSTPTTPSTALSRRDRLYPGSAFWRRSSAG